MNTKTIFQGRYVLMGTILVSILFILFVFSLMESITHTDAPTQNTSTMPTQSIADDPSLWPAAVTAWNTQSAYLGQLLTSMDTLPASTAGVVVSAGSLGYDVMVQWPDGNFVQFVDNLNSGTGFVNSPEGTAAPHSMIEGSSPSGVANAYFANNGTLFLN